MNEQKSAWVRDIQGRNAALLAQLQNPARYSATVSRGSPLRLAKQHSLKDMADTLEESQQVTSGRFKIDATLLCNSGLLGNS